MGCHPVDYSLFSSWGWGWKDLGDFIHFVGVDKEFFSSVIGGLNIFSLFILLGVGSHIEKTPISIDRYIR